MCVSSCVREGKRYPYQWVGFGVREIVAATARNSRAMSLLHGQSISLSVRVIRLLKRHGREFFASAISPQARSVRVHGRNEEQSRVATTHSL